MASFKYVRRVAAPPEIVFDVLTDHRRYTEITPLRKASLEREGDPAPNGVGAIRVLSVAGPPMREEVIAYERPKRFAYKILSGLPVRDHVGTVEMQPAEGGTEIVYAVKTTPTIPLAGPAFMLVLKKAIRDLLSGVAKESERRAADAL
ncbi:MAG TPA: SRPBCC family protein [Solirubrobacterales bacterium]|nr:SRPBCC family protein [Solirubrobacterales bacterium]